MVNIKTLISTNHILLMTTQYILRCNVVGLLPMYIICVVMITILVVTHSFTQLNRSAIDTSSAINLFGISHVA